MTTARGTAFTGVSIDAGHSADLDDALWVERRGNRWILHVQVADPTGSIDIGSDMDLAARERASTVYAGTSVRTPMLPHDVTEAHALQDARDVPCTAIRVEYDEHTLDARTIEIERGMFRSRGRLSYRDAAALVAHGDGPLSSMLRQAYEFALALQQQRRGRGAIAFFDLTHSLMTDESGGIQRVPAAVAHLIVQEAMIAANRAVATWITEAGVPAIFRNHTFPADRAPEAALEVHAALSRGEPLTVAEIQRRFGDLGRASYGPAAQGHMALGLKQYLHFTSPLRRYPDLVNARLIHAILDGQPQPYSPDELAEISQHATDVIRDRDAARAGAYVRTAHRRARNLISRPSQIGTAAPGEFGRLLKQVIPQGTWPEAVETETLRRLDAGMLLERDLTRLLLRNAGEALPQPLQDRLRSHLLAHPHLAPSIWNIGVQNRLLPTYRDPLPSGSSRQQRRVTQTNELLRIAGLPAGPQVPMDASPPDLGRRVVPPLPNGSATAKSALNEYTQAVGCPRPEYETTQAGTAHAPRFMSRVIVHLEEATFEGSGEGANKRKAEAEAAAACILQLRRNDAEQKHATT